MATPRLVARVMFSRWMTRPAAVRRLAGSIAIVGLVAIGAVIVDQLGDDGYPSASSVVSIVPADPSAVLDPVVDGEQLPDGYRLLLDRDQISPVYQPAFTSADRVDWPADSLVLGIAGEVSAKAYPVTHLNQHEMVIDHLEGEPILVSW